MKNRWIAAFLNFEFFGLGTLYVGRRKPLPWALMAVGGTIVGGFEIKLSPLFDNWSLWPFFFAGVILMRVAFAVDAYQEASGVV